MVGIVKRYVCDACCKEEVCGENEELEQWNKTEGWDLCPACTRAWNDYKKSFIVQMRKANGERVI